MFSLFLLSLSFKEKGEKLSGGLYLSFITSLFAEMYGFPLTIYLLSSPISGEHHLRIGKAIYWVYRGSYQAQPF
jgi:hypothetical protein